MKLNKSLLFLFLFLFQTVYSFAQHSYPQGYFLFPIQPGEANHLAANMGELRTNHFHGGLDIKTDRKIGFPVYASAEGYVDRIKISTFGYGNAVYIRHPNNLVTVYAHLDKFNTPIGDYIRKKQYENQSFEVDVYLTKNELPVKKGEVIGLAGNSGSSQGPHLHYEIRDTNDVVLNPALFGFKEITDNIPPVFDRVAIHPLGIDSRVNNEFNRAEYKAVKTGNNYTLENKVSGYGWLGLELKAYDKKNGVYNTFGISQIQVLLDEKEIFRHELNSFTFDETRYINSHINYPVFVETGRRFERLYIADGNQLSSYAANPARGKIFIKDQLNHKVEVRIRDDFNNESVLVFSIQGTTPPSPDVKAGNLPCQGISSEVSENILKLSGKTSGDPGAELYIKGKAIRLPAAYQKYGAPVYLYDLRKGLPDSVKIGTMKEIFNFVKTVPSGQAQQIHNFDKSAFSFAPNALADTLYLEYKKYTENNSEFYQVHHRTVPLFDTLTLSLAPSLLHPNTSKTFVYSVNNGKYSFEGGEWKGDKIEVKTRNLGKFTLAEDTIKPFIKYISHYGNSIKFNIADDLSGIKSFRGMLDGYWVLMNYDHKRRLIWSERLDKTVPLKGKFELEVTDNAGNVNNFIINL